MRMLRFFGQLFVMPGQRLRSYLKSLGIVTQVYFKDCFISTCIATWLSIMLKWDDLPSEYRERLSEELEENYSHGYHSLYICRYVFSFSV